MNTNIVEIRSKYFEKIKNKIEEKLKIKNTELSEEERNDTQSKIYKNNKSENNYYFYSLETLIKNQLI